MAERPTSWLALAIAAVAAAVGALVAPAPWPAGEGAAIVRVDGETVLEAPLPIGDSRPAVLANARVRLTFPAGVPTDARVEATVQPLLDGAPVPATLVGVELTLVLPDGRHELVPIMASAEDGSLRAQRRPPVAAAVMLALLGLVVVLWVSEAIPLFATSLLVPVVLVASGVGAPKAALASFFSPLIALFFGTFLIAEAVRRVGLDRRVAVNIVERFGRSPVTLFAGLMACSAVFSMWMTNTGAVILLIPIAIAVTEPIANLGYRKVVILGIAYAATTGGIGSIVGTPSNAIAVDQIEAFTGRHISFAEWFGFGLPMVVLFVPIIGIYLWWRRGVTVDRDKFESARQIVRDQRAELGPVKPQEWIVVAVFAGVVALWLTSTVHEVHSGIVAIGGALALVLMRQVREEDLANISWNALITFGGGLTLGVYMEQSGTSDWMATSLANLHGVPGFLAIALIAGFTLIVTAFASNTASAAMLIPIALPLAGVLGIDPVTLAIVVAIAASVDYAMVIGTPPTMIAYSTKLFSTKEIFTTGIVLDLLGIIVLTTAVVALWRLFGIA